MTTPLYPSNCYAIPKLSCIIDEPVIEVFDDVTKRFRIPKNNSKIIKFIGIDAVSYEDTDPVTKLHPLSKDVAQLLCCDH